MKFFLILKYKDDMIPSKDEVFIYLFTRRIIMSEYCEKCDTKLINGICPECSQTAKPNTKESKIAKKFFVSPAEKLVTVLGNSFLERFINNGNLEKGFAVVSDKRAYFQGTSYYISYSNNGKRKIVKTQQSRTIDLKDITGTGFNNHSNIGWLIAGIAWLIIPFMLFINTL